MEKCLSAINYKPQTINQKLPIPIPSSRFTYFCLMYTGLSVWQRFIEWDKSLFIKINGQWTSPGMDHVVPFLRNAIFWAPLYILILVFTLINFGKKGLGWSLAFICTVALTDSLGAQL